MDAFLADDHENNADQQVVEALENNADLLASADTASPIEVFHTNISRVARLLDVGAKGIDHNKNMAAGLLIKFEEAEPSTSDTDNPKSRQVSEDSMELSLTERELTLLKELMETEKKAMEELPFYLHNIMCVYAWSAFEGYIQAKIYQVLLCNPSLIESSKQISISEVVAARERIVPWLVGMEVDKVGRLSFRELQKYLSARFKICFSTDFERQLSGYYVIRNVVAHTGGVVRPDQLADVPQGVALERSQLRIHSQFVVEVTKNLRAAVDWFDKALDDRSLALGA